MEKPTAAEIPNVLQARRFELVGDDGAVRAVLGRLPDPDPGAPPTYGLSLLDGEGRARTYLALLPTGPSLTFDHGGNLGVEVGVDDPVPDATRSGPYLLVNFSDGSPAVAWRAGDDGLVQMSVVGTVTP